MLKWDLDNAVEIKGISAEF